MDTFLFGKSASDSPSTPKQSDQTQGQGLDEGFGTDSHTPAEGSTFISMDEGLKQQTSEPPDFEASSSDAEQPPNEPSMYVSPVDSRMEEIGKKAQDLIEKIYENRRVGEDCMSSFQDQLMTKVKDLCRQVNEHMFAVYEENSKLIEEKLQELSEVLQRCSLLNADLQRASQTLVAINKGLYDQPEL
ncbi:synaptonemal complex central element protein 2 [Amia ocellicauda]|uniref:synaptonemal complex central element protein 2 n=1 Tax=Amia ocellicauda TaxID=2972642 RepID=UPI003464BC82